MAEVDIAPNFGQELKDGFKPVNSWVANGITWLEDIQQFYRERSAVEREYSAKLAALARKFYEKKAKKSSSLSVGDTPALTPGSLESASMTTWGTQLTTLEARAAEHDKFGGELLTHIADPLRAFASRFDDVRRRHVEYAERLEKERDGVYGDLRKLKAKYDATCQEVESRRKKTDSSFDHSKAKAQNAYQQQILDMNNAKNTYLISMNVTNKQKERYYYEYLPGVIDSLQDLSESRTTKLNQIWSHAAHLEDAMLKRNSGIIDHLSAEIHRNTPTLDSMMFVRHNAGPWHEPPNKIFEPSSVWHDDDAMIVDDPAKVFLRNVLSKSKAQLGDLRREVDTKRREVEAVKRLKQQIREGKDQRDDFEVARSMVVLQEELHQIDHKRLTAEVETSTITSIVGDVTLGSRTHNFKSQTFTIPTNCDLCGQRIWGLSAKGFDCRDCGYTCHSKCEMKVPAECPGEQSKEDKKKLKTERQEAATTLKAPVAGPTDGMAELPTVSRSNTMTSLSSGYATSAHRSVSVTTIPPASEDGPERNATLKPAAANTTKRGRVVAPPPAAYMSELPGNSIGGSGASTSTEQKGKMLYAYEANDPQEVTVSEGKEVVILEADDGGWTKVNIGYREGLVPTAYLELLPFTAAAGRPSSQYSNSGSSMGGASITAKKQGPAVAPRRGAKKLRYVEAIYDYTAQSDAEHDMSEGDKFILLKEDSGDGWAEVEKGGIVKSVPANYVQNV